MSTRVRVKRQGWQRLAADRVCSYDSGRVRSSKTHLRGSFYLTPFPVREWLHQRGPLAQDLGPLERFLVLSPDQGHEDDTNGKTSTDADYDEQCDESRTCGNRCGTSAGCFIFTLRGDIFGVESWAFESRPRSSGKSHRCTGNCELFWDVTDINHSRLFHGWQCA